MRVIGITGGIGSGKSLVAGILEDKHGAYIVNTDSIAREQMKPGGVSYPGIVGFFGRGILAGDGTIDRSKLSKIVLKDKEKLYKLNELTHPNVLSSVEQEIYKARASGRYPYFIIETALMIESGYDIICDEVWYVRSCEEARRKRLKAERGYTDERIDMFFSSQSKDEDFLKRFTRVINNNNDVTALEEQVEHLLDTRRYSK